VQSQSLTLTNPTGLHARPAALLVKAAGNFVSEVCLYKIQEPDNRANAKSILSVLALGASQGTEIVIETSGEDEEKALETLAALVISLKD
jgi:phosphocarrier protein HPr